MKYPEFLITASLHMVKINNMNKCANLANIYSCWNTYSKHDIESLSNIKRIYSYYDKYQNSNTSMLEDLLTNNTLECIYIENCYSDGNIVSSMTLSRNIDNLRYIRIFQYKANYDIILDASNEFLISLRVYNVLTKKNNYYKYGALLGPTTAVQRLEAALVHDLKCNV